MKKIIIFLVANLLAINIAFSQGAAINTTGANADPSAMLDVSGTNSGVLINRLTDAQKQAIPSPATGLMIYQTDGAAGFYYFNGAAWTYVGSDNLGNHTATQILDMATKKVINVATCTQNLDAANKTYVDSAVAAGGGTTCCPTHSLGELYGGGVVYYIYTPGGVEHGLIVSPIDISISAQWSNVTSIRIGTTTYMDGSDNTTKIIGQSGHISSAALLCRNYNGGGFNDWYLPAIDELMMIHKERYVINRVLGTNGIKYGLNNDNDDYYWSSTEGPYCTNCVWGYYGLYDSAFHPNGNASWNYDNSKNMTKAVRCVRSF